MTVGELRTEIREGCDAIEETQRHADELAEIAAEVGDAERIYAVGMGSSYWTAVMAAAVFRDVGRDATAVSASEFAFTPHPADESTVVVGFSESGETGETIHAMETAREAGATTVSIVNTGESTLDDLADYSFVTPAGVQHTVLATKSVDSALTAAYVVADAVAGGEYVDLTGEADYCQTMLDVDVSAAVAALTDVGSVYALGVGSGYGLAGEAATKLGEGPLVHTSPLPLLEIDHGPHGNVEGDAVIVVATYPIDPGIYEDTVAMLQEVGATTIVLSPQGADYGGDVTISYPAESETVLPAMKAVQRVAVDLGVERDVEVDHLPDLDDEIDLSAM